MIEEALRTQLEPVVDRRRRLSLAWRLSLYWLTAGVVGLFLIGADRLLGWRSPLALASLCLAVVAATVWAIYRVRRLRPDYRAIARHIEQQHPDLKALLLAAIEQKPEGPEGRFGYLQHQVLLQAVSHATHHDWMQTIPPRTLALANFSWFAALGFLLFVLLLLWPAHRPGAPARTVLLQGGYSITVTPGDTEVEKGSPVVILGRFEGQLPSAVDLLFGPPGQTPQRMALTKSLNDPVFGGMIQETSSNLLYRLEYAGWRTRDYTISIFQSPELVRADARIVYPAYTKLPAKTVEDTRQISVVEGSEVTLTFMLNKPVQTARLAPRSGVALGLAIDREHPNVLTTSFTATQSQQYDLHLADAQGRANKMPPRFVIDVQKNLPPQLTPLFPANDVVVSPLEELVLEAKVADDYGLLGYGLTYSLIGAKNEEITLGTAQPDGIVKAEGPARSGLVRAYRIASDDATTNVAAEPQIRYLLALEDLGAEPDQLLTYYFWAEDMGPDGKPRRTASDMYFAEVRPFEEIFRESQSFQDGQNQEQQQNQEGQERNQSGEQLARLQKQIISATWNIKQQAERAGGITGRKDDVEVVRQSQAGVLEQARQALTEAEDPAAAKSLQAAAEHMEKAVEHLTKASESAATTELTPALSAEQAAYQELLKLRQREHQVARGRNSGQRNNASSERLQRQLQQLELTQRENRYETQQLAQSRQQESRQEDLQMLNRLRDLARRQSEMSERLRETEAALRQARDEQQRQDLLRELQRLRDEQLQALRDTDEIGRQMDRAQNRQRMADARQRLDESRSEIRQSAEALEQGRLSQAQTSATRAQRQLEQMREELQRRTSSQFADQMRDMRDQAQQLDQRQNEIAGEIGREIDARQKTLAGPEVGPELAERVDRQKENMRKLLEEVKTVSEQAEVSEPLLSRKLYDTLRQASMGDTDKALEATGELLRRNFLPQAQEIERRAGAGIEQLRRGVEEAARNVLGDEAESLRLARRQLDELIEEAGGEPTARAGGRERQQPGDANNPMDAGTRQRQADAERRPGGERQEGQSAERQGTPQDAQQSQQAQQGGAPREGGQPQESEDQRARAEAGERPGDRAGDRQGRPGERRAEGVPPSERGQELAPAQAGDARDTGTIDGGGSTGPRGPFTDERFRQWAGRLRDVEDMLPQRDLREEAARIWDRARAIRAESRRHSKEPQWDLVQMQVMNPLVELRQRVSERLAQLQSKEAMVPIDRDPVPDRFAELVRAYFENLGQGAQ
ncbi:MAG: hypothetical protein FJ280_03235 [Planctomycetes bacterium]|nr:hypothetical protein [Planctomycetota bacterium]